jgi:hypothetical protein
MNYPLKEDKIYFITIISGNPELIFDYLTE